MGTLAALLVSFFKIGCVGYGGGPSMVPLIKEEVVNLQGWLSTSEFIDVLAVANALPGPLASKLSVAIGYEVSGIAGALAATIGILAPSTVALLLLLRFVSLVKDNPRVRSLLTGLRPVVVALLAYAAWDMSGDSLSGAATYLIAGISLALMALTRLHPALLIIAGAVAGALLRL